MSTDQVNYLNILLMVVSLVAAVLLPFEVFLFSYAVLGPLHYLTEISWLHDRKYFTNPKWDGAVLAGLSVLAMAWYFKLVGGEVTAAALQAYVPDLLFLAFGLALVFVVGRSTGARLLLLALLIALAIALHGSTPRDILFALYLPTIIHVFLFTGAFIFFGSLKEGSVSGYVSLGVFCACAIATFVVGDSLRYSVSELARRTYEPFQDVNLALNNDLGLQIKSIDDVYTSVSGISIMRFIAWAYTYHYLNWFSKTSVIQWHKVPKGRFVVVVLAWLVSIGVYLWNCELGYKWLLLLSTTHVLLEFPLNHRSFIGIGAEIGKRFRRSGGLATPR